MNNELNTINVNTISDLEELNPAYVWDGEYETPEDMYGVQERCRGCKHRESLNLAGYCYDCAHDGDDDNGDDMSELMNDVHKPLNALKFGMTRDEALKQARWYQERERCADVQYKDTKHGKGVFTVNSMGIFERDANAVISNEVTLHVYLVEPDSSGIPIVTDVFRLCHLNDTARKTKEEKDGWYYVQDAFNGEGEYAALDMLYVTERVIKIGGDV